MIDVADDARYCTGTAENLLMPGAVQYTTASTPPPTTLLVPAPAPVPVPARVRYCNQITARAIRSPPGDSAAITPNGAPTVRKYAHYGVPLTYRAYTYFILIPRARGDMFRVPAAHGGEFRSRLCVYTFNFCSASARMRQWERQARAASTLISRGTPTLRESASSAPAADVKASLT